MWKSIQKTVLAFLLLTASGTAAPQNEQKLDLQARSILVYNSIINGENSQFVIRIARFLPDRVFEWESTAFQGTVHLYRSAVEGAECLTYGKLFEAGVSFDSSDTVTKWLSGKMYRELLEKGKGRFKLNNMKADFSLEGREHYALALDGEEILVPAIRVKDSRKGIWLFQDDPDNPVLLKYVSPYFHEELTRVSNAEENQLRWIRKLPPVN